MGVVSQVEGELSGGELSEGEEVGGAKRRET